MSVSTIDASSIRGRLTLLDGATLVGSAVEPQHPEKRFVVEILADGLVIGVVRAIQFDADLAREGLGDACYGFRFDLPASILADPCDVSCHLANADLQIGEAIRIDPRSIAVHPGESMGQVGWAGGMTLEGHLGPSSLSPGRTVQAIVDGDVVAAAEVRDWTTIRIGKSVRSARSFRLDLPSSLADGIVRHVDVVASDGTRFLGSPCFVIGFPDGLAHFIEGRAELLSERERVRQIDGLFPQSFPFADVGSWQERFPVPSYPVPDEGGSTGVVLVGQGDGDASLASLGMQNVTDWVAAWLPERGRGLRFHPENLREFLLEEAPLCDILVFAPAGTTLEAEALSCFRAALHSFPQAASAYCDRLDDEAGSLSPVLLPAFDYERCLEQGYGAIVFAMRRDAVLAGLDAGADSLVRLFGVQLDRPMEESGQPLHCPHLLARVPPLDRAALMQDLALAAMAHVQARGERARPEPLRATGWPGVRIVREPAQRPLSIVLLVRDETSGPLPCCDLLRQVVRDARIEIVIASHCDPQTIRGRLGDLGTARIIGVNTPPRLNLSHAHNLAAEASSGELLLFLDSDLESGSPGWLEEMLGRIDGPNVGAVGALTLWSTGVVRHAGFVLGPGFSAKTAFGDRLESEPGYTSLLQCAHQCCALSRSALLTRRKSFLDLGGFDEINFPNAFGDVDFGLRLGASGARILMTPHARLRYARALFYDKVPHVEERYRRELQNLRYRWAGALMSDASYHPALAIDGSPFSALAWPPRARDARQRRAVQGRTIPFGL